ncbi:MAG: class I SAM-dependent methyltransferase, partial [Nitrososphaera sp.]
VKLLIPKRARSALREILYFPFDTMEVLLGKRDELTPPKRKIYVGGGDFRKSGERFLRYFIGYGGLTPEQRVLDVGSGIGRMAVALTGFLDKGGSYEGFDTVDFGVAWCKRRISSRYANFSFRFVDIYNKAYNPEGKLKPSQYKFPYKDQEFDFVILTSVFTHMRSQDMQNYLSEVARVLKNGGRCLITFFLLNAESLELLRAGKADLNFVHETENSLSVDSDTPEGGIAFYEDFVRELYEKNGLSIKAPIHYGSWCRRERVLDFQDIIIAVKT